MSYRLRKLIRRTLSWLILGTLFTCLTIFLAHERSLPAVAEYYTGSWLRANTGFIYTRISPVISKWGDIRIPWSPAEFLGDPSALRASETRERINRYLREAEYEREEDLRDLARSYTVLALLSGPENRFAEVYKFEIEAFIRRYPWISGLRLESRSGKPVYESGQFTDAPLSLPVPGESGGYLKASLAPLMEDDLKGLLTDGQTLGQAPEGWPRRAVMEVDGSDMKLSYIPSPWWWYATRIGVFILLIAAGILGFVLLQRNLIKSTQSAPADDPGLRKLLEVSKESLQVASEARSTLVRLKEQEASRLEALVYHLQRLPAIMASTTSAASANPVNGPAKSKSAGTEAKTEHSESVSVPLRIERKEDPVSVIDEMASPSTSQAYDPPALEGTHSEFAYFQEDLEMAGLYPDSGPLVSDDELRPMPLINPSDVLPTFRYNPVKPLFTTPEPITPFVSRPDVFRYRDNHPGLRDRAKLIKLREREITDTIKAEVLDSLQKELTAGNPVRSSHIHGPEVLDLDSV